jgi:hypothetical protein
MAAPDRRVHEAKEPSMDERKRRGTAVKLALLGAGVAAGAIAASAITANAATTNGTGTTATGYTATSGSAGSAGSSGSSSGGPAGAPAPQGRPANNHGSAPVRSDEKAVSAALAAKLKAEALKAVPGGTVYRVETDAGDATYEAHMTKADGTEVTVKFDKNLKVTAVEAGMGKGDPAPPQH